MEKGKQKKTKTKLLNKQTKCMNLHMPVDKPTQNNNKQTKGKKNIKLFPLNNKMRWMNIHIDNVIETQGKANKERKVIFRASFEPQNMTNDFTWSYHRNFKQKEKRTFHHLLENKISRIIQVA